MVTDIVKKVELLEPGKAIPKGRGYVGLASDSITFPYVSSCLAVVAVLKSGTLVGGHMGAEWSEGAGIDYKGNGKKILDLMVGNLENVDGKGKVAAVVTVGHGNWSDVIHEVWGRLTPDGTLKVECQKEVDVVVTKDKVLVKQVSPGKAEKTYKVPSDGQYPIELFK